MAGTEIGVTRPTATFSSCYGAPFLAMHPSVYADMLAKKLRAHAANAWLINTGWVGGAAGGTGYRCPLEYTRRILDAIHNGSLLLPSVKYEATPVFNLFIPVAVEGVPSNILFPKKSWPDVSVYLAQLRNLGQLFVDNFAQYADRCAPEVLQAGPRLNSFF